MFISLKRYINSKLFKNILLILVLILCSCSHNTKQNNNKNVFYGELISKYEVADLSDYKWIDEDSRFLNITFEECINILESGTGIIYIGSENCKWCQRIVPELNSLANEENIYVLYVDASQSFLGSQYDRIVEILNEYLDNNELTAPTVVAVEKGKIKGFHKGVVEGFEIIDETTQLNDEQKDNLRRIYNDMIDSITYE